MVGESIWAFLVVGGFIILGLGMAYAKFRNVQAGKDEPVHRDGTPPNLGKTRDGS
jgi:hypothetical protein